jgi:hypothetical protein
VCSKKEGLEGDVAVLPQGPGNGLGHS